MSARNSSSELRKYRSFFDFHAIEGNIVVSYRLRFKTAFRHTRFVVEPCWSSRNSIVYVRVD